MSRQHAIFAAAALHADLELEQGGLVLTFPLNGVTLRSCRCNVGKADGTWSGEWLAYGVGVLTGNCRVGVATAAATLASGIGADAYGVGLDLASGDVYWNGGSVASLGAGAIDQWFGMVCDVAAGTLAFFRDGTEIGSVALDASLAGATLYPAGSIGGPVGRALRLFWNGGQRAFARPATMTAYGWYSVPPRVPVARIASRHYITRGTDDPPHTRYEAGLPVSGMRIKRSLHFPIWGPGGSRASAAQVTINDASGRFDHLARAGVRDLPARLRVGYTDEALSEATDVAHLVFERADVVDDSRKRLVFRSTLSRLDAPLQRRLIPPNATGGSANRPWPIARGAPLGFQPVCINEAAKRFAMNDGTMGGLAAVRDSGDPLDASLGDYTIEPGGETFTTDTVPVGTLTVDGSSVGGGATVTNLLAGVVWDASVGYTAGAGDFTLEGNTGLGTGSNTAAYVLKNGLLTAGKTYRFTGTIEYVLQPGGAYVPITYVRITTGISTGAMWSPIMRTSAGVLTGTFVAPSTGFAISIGEASGIARNHEVRIADDVELYEVVAEDALEDSLEPLNLLGYGRELLGRRAELSTAEYSEDDLAAIDTATGFAGSDLFMDEQRSTRAVMDEVLVGYMACLYEERAGRARTIRLTPPEDVAEIDRAFTLRRRDMASQLKKKVDYMPGLTTRVAGKRTWHVMTDGDLAKDSVDVTLAYRRAVAAPFRAVRATGVPLAPCYRHAEMAEPLETLLHDPADIQAAADHMAGLATVERAFYEAEVFDGSTYELGQVGTLEYPLYGLEAGVAVVVVDIDEDPVTKEAILTLWGESC